MASASDQPRRAGHLGAVGVGTPAPAPVEQPADVEPSIDEDRFQRLPDHDDDHNARGAPWIASPLKVPLRDEGLARLAWSVRRRNVSRSSIRLRALDWKSGSALAATSALGDLTCACASAL